MTPDHPLASDSSAIPATATTEPSDLKPELQTKGVEPFLLHMPVSIRSLSLVILAGFAGLFVLHWAKAVFIPLMLGLMLSYALSPLVNWMELRRVPRWLGAAVLLLSILGAVGGTSYALTDEAVKLVESLPAAAQKFRQTIKSRRDNSSSTLETMQKAATQIEQAAQEGAPPPTANSKGAIRVVVEPTRFNIKDYLWTGTLGLVALVGQFTVVIFLTYFLMVMNN